MFKFSATLFLILTSCTLPAQAQEQRIELVDYFTAYEHSFRCDFSKSVLAELKNQTESEIESTIQDEISNIQDTLLDPIHELSHTEKYMLYHQKRILKRLLKTSHRKEGIQKFFQGLCSGTEFTVSTTAKSIAYGSNVINQSFMLPVRFVYRFFKGLSTGKTSNDSQLTLYDAIGKNKYRYVAFYGLYRAYKVFMASNPSTIPFLLTPMADYLAMNVCENKTKLRPDELKFCSNYEGIKQRYFKVAKQGEAIGAKLSKHQKDDQKPKSTLPSEVTDENLCDFLRLVNDDKTNSEKYVDFKKVMLLMNTPGYYSTPTSKELLTTDSMMRKKNASSIPTLRNIIVSLAPRDSIRDELQAKGEVDDYKANLKKLGKLQKIYGKLYRSKSKEQCLLKKENHQFNLKEYETLKAKVDADRNLGYLFQHSLVQKQIKKAEGRFQFFNKTKLNWEVIPADTLNEVHQLLRSPDVGNVIIVSHTESTYGKLVDSSIAQYPKTFFSDLSPSLMSLSFYSCHSDKILKTFDLEEKFLNSPSFHRKRKLNFAQDSQMIDGNGSPLSGFGDFLIRVDQDLFPLTKGNMLHQSLMGKDYSSFKQDACKVSLGDLKVEKGTMSVIINRHFVGTINRFETGTEFEFPCNIVDRDENVLLLQNHSLVETYPESMDLTIKTLSLSMSGLNVKFDEAQRFYNDEITKTGYLSSKVIFRKK